MPFRGGLRIWQTGCSTWGKAVNDGAFDWLGDDSSSRRRWQKGFGVAELLGLPDSMREVALEVTRREPVGLAELTRALGRNPVDVEMQISQLVMQGWLDVEEGPSGEWVYRARIASSPGPLLPPGIWQVIDNQWQVPLLRLFPDAAREEFTQRFRLVRHRADELLFEAGSWQERMYIVASGQVHLLVENEQGETFVVRRVRPGGLFGEMAVLLGERTPFTALVAEDSQIWSMGKDDLRKLLLQYPAVGLAVRRELSRRLYTQPAARAKREHNPILAVGQAGAELAQCLADESGAQVVLVDLTGERAASEGSLTIVDGLGMHSTDIAQKVQERAARGEWVVVAAPPQDDEPRDADLATGGSDCRYDRRRLLVALYCQRSELARFFCQSGGAGPAGASAVWPACGSGIVWQYSAVHCSHRGPGCAL